MVLHNVGLDTLFFISILNCFAMPHLKNKQIIYACSVAYKLAKVAY
jgi:hypothetical protein